MTRAWFDGLAVTTNQRRAISAKDKMRAWAALTKPRITCLVVLNAWAGFALGVTGSLARTRKMFLGLLPLLLCCPGEWRL